MTNIDTDVDNLLPLTMLATCAGGSCPTIFESDRGTYVVQGYAVEPSQVGLSVPPGELLVEIPVLLLDRVKAGRSSDAA